MEDSGEDGEMAGQLEDYLLDATQEEMARRQGTVNSQKGAGLRTRSRENPALRAGRETCRAGLELRENRV